MRPLFVCVVLLLGAGARPALAGQERVFVQASSLNLRQGDGARARVLVKLPINAQLEVLKTAGDKARVRVVSPDFYEGLQGWVARAFVGARPVVLDELVAAANAAEDPDQAVSLWQRANALAPGDGEIGQKLVDAYIKAGRDADATWWKGELARAQATPATEASPLRQLQLVYEFFGGRGLEPPREDLYRSGCGPLESCKVSWSGKRHDLRAETLSCRPVSDAKQARRLAASDVVGRMVRDAAQSPELKPGAARVVKQGRLDLDRDGAPDPFYVVSVSTTLTERAEREAAYPYGAPTCTRTIARLRDAWVPLTTTSCGRDVQGQTLVAAFRVRGLDGTVLQFVEREVGSNGASLWLWKDGKAERLPLECGGNG